MSARSTAQRRERERGRGGGTAEKTTVTTSIASYSSPRSFFTVSTKLVRVSKTQAQGSTHTKNNLLSCTSLVHNHTVRWISSKNSHRVTHILSIKALSMSALSLPFRFWVFSCPFLLLQDLYCLVLSHKLGWYRSNCAFLGFRFTHSRWH